jgi:hypothetical protein
MGIHHARSLIISGLTLLLTLAPGMTHSEPAVSALNAKVTAFGGGGDFAGNGDRGVGGIAGSLTAPLMMNLGLQIDGAYARAGDDNFFNTGAHLFWRDPTSGMIGIYGGFAHISGFGGQDIGRLGLEAQRYSGNLTIDGAAGWRFGDLSDRAYGRAKVAYYPLDNLMLSAGFLYEGRSFGTLSGEYQIANGPGAGMSLFADAQIGDDRNVSVLGGLRIFLGPQETLISRHRRQDPENYVHPDLTAGQQAMDNAQRNQSRQNQTPPAQCPFTPSANVCIRAEQCAGTFGFPNTGVAACNCASAYTGCT